MSALVDLPITPRRMGEWRDRGACAGHPTSTFFPERGNMAPVKEAKAICADCPVKAECLDWALTLPEESGIWGGLSAKERRGMGRTRKICRLCGETYPTSKPGDHSILCRPCKAERIAEQHARSAREAKLRRREAS